MHDKPVADRCSGESRPRLGCAEKIAIAAGALGALPVAQAAVIYHSGSVGPVGLGDPVSYWDVDAGNPNNNGPEFALFPVSNVYISMPSYGLNARGMVQGGAALAVGRFRKLSTGFMIGPTMQAGYQWGNPGQPYRPLMSAWMGNGYVASAASWGGFTGGGDEYFGFRFTDSTGGLYYAWGSLFLDTANAQVSISCWAYNDTAGQGIAVGDTGGSSTTCGTSATANPIPEPGTLPLALLGAGAAGVRRWRSRRQAQAAVAA